MFSPIYYYFRFNVEYVVTEMFNAKLRPVWFYIYLVNNNQMVMFVFERG